ncbi:hypothetical protein MTO96_032709 [Rhipicephalus appendiculatus]
MIFQTADGKAVDYLRYTVVKVVPNARCADKSQHTDDRKPLMYSAYTFNTDACQRTSSTSLPVELTPDAVNRYSSLSGRRM